jgi:hypothetical protein
MLVGTSKVRKSVLIAVIVAGLPASLIQAQLTDDPATLPWPDLSHEDPNRAVVISVTFNSPTNVVADDVIVSETRAKSFLGAPPLILIELLDQHGAVLAQQNAWHPLWVRDLNEDDGEFTPVTESGPGTFYVPLDEDLRSVRITDIELGMELITVDVSGPVEAYCAQMPQPALCSILKSSFE